MSAWFLDSEPTTCLHLILIETGLEYTYTYFVYCCVYEMFYPLCVTGKPMSESKVRREIGLTTVDNSLSNLELQQKPSALSSSDDHFKRRKSHLSKGRQQITSHRK